MTNIFERLGFIKPKIDIPYSRNFFEMDIIGNKRTGYQIEDWKSKAGIEISRKFDNWDGKSELFIEIPNDGKGEIETFNKLLKDKNLPKKIPDLGYFSLYKSSKVTDFISGSFISQYGIIISNSAKLIFEKFNLGQHRFYPLVLEHKGQKFEDYFLLKTLATSDNFIDISKSVFYHQKPIDEPGGKIQIEFNNQKEIDEFHSKSKEKDYFDSSFVRDEQLVLDNKFPNYDLFYSNKFSYNQYPVLSERLRNSLTEMSGVVFVKTNRII